MTGPALGSPEEREMVRDTVRASSEDELVDLLVNLRREAHSANRVIDVLVEAVPSSQ